MVAQWAQSLVCAGIVLLVPSMAFAQAATALDRFEPAPAGDGSFAVPRASIPGNLRVSGALAFSYAHDPLKLRSYDVTSGETLGSAAIVDHQLTAHVLASVEVARRVKFDLDVPFTLSQGGESPSVGDTTTVLPSSPQSFVSPAGAAMNDIRLGARVALVRQSGWIPAASLAYSVWFPSGNTTAYTSTGLFRHAPSIIVGAERGRFNWSVMLGRRVQDSRDGAGLLGGEVLGGASFAARFDKITAHAELFGTMATSEKSTITSSMPSVELLLGARYTLGPLSAGLIGGPGLFRGIGNPTFRIIASVGATFDAPASKKQSQSNAADTNRRVGTSAKTNQPSKPKENVVEDRDGDTVADQSDVCPDVVGDPAPDAARRGCPSDRDGDSIADSDDRCPDEKGVATPDPARFGCPLDSDGDGFVDAVDACPKEKGEANEDPKKSGCPRSVRLVGTQIVILQEVNFATGSDVITPDSFSLLEQVASVLAQHPEITRLAIDGHTDNVGNTAKNVTLSQKRAVAVITWLVEHGIDARRLEARGFGPRRPIVSNDTDAGKAKNRRVEFQILKRSDEGAAAWRAGTAQ